MKLKLPTILSVVATAMISLSGCGISSQTSPVAIDTATPTSTTPSHPPAGTSSAPVTLYFVSPSSHLVPSRVGSTNDLNAVIDQLLVGPTSRESAAGITTAIPTGTKLLSASTSGDSAKVDFSDQLASISGQEQLLAFAQIVTTATSLSTISRVQVSVDGQTVNAPLPDGTLAQGPVTQADYASLFAH